MSKRDEVIAIIVEGCDQLANVQADRILACIAVPSGAMVEAALAGLLNTPEGDEPLLERMARAALIAGLRAMVKP